MRPRQRLLRDLLIRYYLPNNHIFVYNMMKRKVLSDIIIIMRHQPLFHFKTKLSSKLSKKINIIDEIVLSLFQYMPSVAVTEQRDCSLKYSYLIVDVDQLRKSCAAKIVIYERYNPFEFTRRKWE